MPANVRERRNAALAAPGGAARRNPPHPTSPRRTAKRACDRAPRATVCIGASSPWRPGAPEPRGGGPVGRGRRRLVGEVGEEAPCPVPLSSSSPLPPRRLRAASERVSHAGVIMKPRSHAFENAATPNLPLCSGRLRSLFRFFCFFSWAKMLAPPPPPPARARARSSGAVDGGLAHAVFSRAAVAVLGLEVLLLSVSERFARSDAVEALAHLSTEHKQALVGSPAAASAAADASRGARCYSLFTLPDIFVYCPFLRRLVGDARIEMMKKFFAKTSASHLLGASDLELSAYFRVIKMLGKGGYSTWCVCDACAAVLALEGADRDRSAIRVAGPPPRVRRSVGRRDPCALPLPLPQRG